MRTKNRSTNANAKRWQSKEDDVIIKCINESPQNLNFAFEQAAAKLAGRTYGGVSQRYYKALMHDKTKSPMLALASSSGMRVINRKNSPIPKKAKTNEMRMEVVMDCVDEMSLEEKKKVVKYILQVRH
jgi:hypothetical protein